MSNLEQLSEEYFEKCENLRLVEEPFQISSINEQIKIRDLQNEFELIRAITQTKKHKMRLRSNNVFQNKKNRYPEQAIYDHSRVMLNKEYCDNKNEQGYINANFISILNQDESQSLQKLILTQGPVQPTVNDFKNMIVQQKIDCVIMLCRLIQNGKSRCSEYLGDCVFSDQRMVQDYLIIKNIDLGEDYGKYSYEHVYYSEWPDKKVPSELKHIQQLIQIVKHHKNVIIHCSAGLGRSGVIAAILLTMVSSQFKRESKISIFRTVRKMREYRFGAVQNSQQYKFIYQFFQQLNTDDTLV